MGIIGLKSRCGQGGIHSGGPGANLFPCLFQRLEATSIPWLVVSSSTFKASCVATSSLSHPDHCFCPHISFSDYDSPPLSFTYRSPVILLGPLRQSRVIFPSEDPNPPAKSLLPCEATQLHLWVSLSCLLYHVISLYQNNFFH